jgi:hypothetical protein
MLASTVSADALKSFETHLSAGNAAGVETQFKRLDEENIASGNTKNGILYNLISEFRSTKPEITALLVEWKKQAPDSIYRKTASAVHLDHIAWIVRGNETSHYTYAKAFDQMFALQAEANKLAWEVFHERTDFAPASSIIATNYASNHGEMPMNKFAKLALAANPSPTMLDNIVYAANPKWGGSWEEIEYYCNQYGEKVVTNNWYTIDGCKATAIYQMASTLRGGNQEQVTWARSVLESAPVSALRNARHTDMFYLRRETISPENKDLAVSLFHPASRHAQSFTRRIQEQAGIKGFYDEQLPKIEEAKRKHALNDPYNPAHIFAMRDIIYSKHPHTVQPSHYGDQIVVASSRSAMNEYASYLDEVAKIAPFRPEVWAAKAGLQMMSPGGQLLLERNRINRERAILYSNYKPKYVFSYVRYLFVMDMNVRPKFSSSAKNNGDSNFDR